MRITLPGAIALLLLAGVAGAQSGFVERYKAATAAHAAKDYARMEAELREALKLRPAHPTAMYKLASAQALRGQSQAAIDTLSELADMGLVFDPDADTDYAALKGVRGFSSVRRAFARNRDDARGDAERMFRLKSPTFIPEGIAYDPERRHFYVGSVHERRIVRVLRDDTEVEFAGPDKLWAVFGMSADPERDLLWVTTAAIPEMKDAKADDLGKTAIVGFQLKSGEQKARLVLGEKGEHQLGDVIAHDGKLYTTDSRGGTLYAVDPRDGKFKALTRPGELSSPQGLVVSRDEKHLYIADYTQGLYRYTFDGGKLERLEVAKGISVYGIDGLYRYRNDLLVIQNGIKPHRVARIELADRGRKVRHLRVLAANLKAFDEPTLGVVVDKAFYFVANSQWGKFDDQGRLPPPEQLRRPQVMRIQFGGGDAPLGADPAPVPTPQPSPLPCVPPLC